VQLRLTRALNDNRTSTALHRRCNVERSWVMAQTARVDRPEAVAALPADLPRWRFTVDDFHRMGEVGILDEDDRVELIDGEIIAMSPIGFRHARIVNNLNRLLVTRAGDRSTVSVQNPLVLSDYGEPQPDVVLLTGDGPRDHLPTPADILLVVEVSDTTLAYDLNVKLPRYARAGVPEVWIVDVAGDAFERFTDPKQETGQYASRERFGRDDEIHSATLPDLRIPVQEALR
jgi:Uma2 family endonuclease